MYQLIKKKILICFVKFFSTQWKFRYFDVDFWNYMNNVVKFNVLILCILFCDSYTCKKRHFLLLKYSFKKEFLNHEI